MEAEELINRLEMLAHPEGGYYRETYRASERIPASVLPARFTGDRSFSTSIFFLLKYPDFSCLHMIKADETWHFYLGDPLKIVSINKQGMLEEAILGNRLDKGEIPQLMIPNGYWFGASLAEKKGFALVGCTVSPGFDFEDINYGKREDLLKQFPHLEDIILDFTR
ncbi:MAG: cupin domain-containing protein [Bacteroidota bacterium]